jgi:uncharacterized protein (DUF983 family)
MTEEEKHYFVEDFTTRYIEGECKHCGIKQIYQVYNDEVIHCSKCGKKIKIVKKL